MSYITKFHVNWACKKDWFLSATRKLAGHYVVVVHEKSTNRVLQFDSIEELKEWRKSDV